VIQPFHRFCPWWHCIMDEHRNCEVAISELRRDHAQMFPNCLLTIGIVWVVAGNFDRSTIRKEMEMMGRLLVTEPHGLVAAGIHSRKMLFRARRRRWALCE
jgi:hypothetical protein